MKLKAFLKLTLISLLLEIVISPARGYPGFRASLLIGFTAYFFFTIYYLKRIEKSLSVIQVLSAVVMGLFMIQVPLRMLSFTTSLSSFPDFVFHFLGAIFGFLYFKLPRHYNWLSTGLGISMALFMFFKGYDLWLHKLNFGTFSGRVSYALPVKFEAFDQNRNLVADKDFANKVVLLDFWNTSCGICFQKFPQLQKFYEQHKSNAAIRILAVDTPLEDDKEGDAFKAIKDEGHTFPVVITKDAHLAEQYGVTGYPTTFVIDRQGKVVFKGSIEGATKLAEELLKAG